MIAEFWARMREAFPVTHVRIDLDRDLFEQVKKMLGTGMTRKRVWSSRSTGLASTIPTVKEKAIDDYDDMQGFSYLDDGIEGEDTWRTI